MTSYSFLNVLGIVVIIMYIVFITWISFKKPSFINDKNSGGAYPNNYKNKKLTMEKLGLDNNEKQGSIVFTNDDITKPPILELRKNGDIYVNGRIVENDKQVVNGLRNFLKIND